MSVYKEVLLCTQQSCFFTPSLYYKSPLRALQPVPVVTQLCTFRCSLVLFRRGAKVPVSRVDVQEEWKLYDGPTRPARAMHNFHVELLHRGRFRCVTQSAAQTATANELSYLIIFSLLSLVGSS
jgi:hypothetical protein